MIVLACSCSPSAVCSTQVRLSYELHHAITLAFASSSHNEGQALIYRKMSQPTNTRVNGDKLRASRTLETSPSTGAWRISAMKAGTGLWTLGCPSQSEGGFMGPRVAPPGKLGSGAPHSHGSHAVCRRGTCLLVHSFMCWWTQRPFSPSSGCPCCVLY